jgi:hypothetical protein
MRRLAFRLARWAGRLLGHSRAEWAQAMEAELHYLDDSAALRLAVGFVLLGIRERMDAMTPCTAERLNIALSMLFAVALLSWKLLSPQSAKELLPLALSVYLVPVAYLSAKARRRR